MMDIIRAESILEYKSSFIRIYMNLVIQQSLIFSWWLIFLLISKQTKEFADLCLLICQYIWLNSTDVFIFLGDDK
jgi:histone acetyltransferase (RNA polymerase elongator complex component)